VVGNLLLFGDNLVLLRRHVPDGSVDLAYLDPPFGSSRDRYASFSPGNRSGGPDEPLWPWDSSAERYFAYSIEADRILWNTMSGLRLILGESQQLAFMAMIAPRLLEIRRVLKPRGIVLWQLDPGLAPYAKLLMDAVFGAEEYRGQIAWCYSERGHRLSRRGPGKPFDLILKYGRGWTDSRLPAEMRRPGLSELIGGRDRTPRHHHYPGPPRHDDTLDSWTDIPCLSPTDDESVGLANQKPVALLERLISDNTDRGATVLDPFAGSGTTLVAAQRLDRTWIGVDISHAATAVIKERLRGEFGHGPLGYEVVGEPTTLREAVELSREDPYQYGRWVLGLLGAWPAADSAGRDRGIDGLVYFRDDPDSYSKTKTVVISVTAGVPSLAHVKDLVGALKREQAEIAVLVTVAEPSKQVMKAAAEAGFYLSPQEGRGYRRLQILSLAEVLAGAAIDCPRTSRGTPKSDIAPARSPLRDDPFRDEPR